MTDLTGRVLVVDDEATMRDAVELTLSRMGFSVELAKNGDEAAGKIGPGKFNLMVTDVKMPKMSGIDLLRQARQQCPEMPVLVMTGYGTIGNAVEAMKFGAADYIVKPFSAEVLEQAVRDNLLDDIELNTGESGSNDRVIITNDAGMKKLIKIAKNVAPSDATVLLAGESGTGKELVARYIHRNSNRAKGPFVAFNCAAMPETLMESELFGHEKGSFTGAHQSRKGKFELADGGTILLDEISEMDVALQAKLLRVIQEREIDRVGSDRPIPVDVRIIATTNADLKKRVEQGRFREDLYFRLAVIPLTLPPLRNRIGDIDGLVTHFLTLYSRRHHKNIERASEKTIARLRAAPWKGNVRELSNTIERAVLMCDGAVLEPEHLVVLEPASSGAGANFENFVESVADSNQNHQFHQAVECGSKPGVESLQDMEKRTILQALAHHENNRTRAAKDLGISIRTLRNKLKAYEFAQ